MFQAFAVGRRRPEQVDDAGAVRRADRRGVDRVEGDDGQLHWGVRQFRAGWRAATAKVVRTAHGNEEVMEVPSAEMGGRRFGNRPALRRGDDPILNAIHPRGNGFWLVRSGQAAL
ncbi:hypothetical protein GCM10010278_36300 [Streptomyces melanogenes]|nr:hypothetical protein GCM10010278_36300 [Streptomyces melanogenes]